MTAAIQQLYIILSFHLLLINRI